MAGRVCALLGCVLLLTLLGFCSVAGAEEESAAVGLPEVAPAPETESDVGPQETEAIPEISVEVVGVREGLLSISPAPGEVVVAVDAQEIEDAGAQTVADALVLTPSVFIRHQGARYENRLSIRGAAPRLVLLDGIPIAREGYTGLGGGAGGKEAGFAGRILYTLPADVIERIDVIRSVGTVVYGPTAGTGAVINIVTKEPDAGEQLNVATTYGSYGRHTRRLYAGASDGRLSYLVTAGTEYAESHLPLGERRFNDIFTRLIHDEEDGSRLVVEYFSLDGHRTLDLSQDFSIVPARYWRINPWEEDFANIVYSKAISDEETLDFVFYGRNREFVTNLYTNDSFSRVKRNWLESQDDLGADLRYSVRHDDGRMTRTGLQWSKITSDTIDTTYIGSGGPLPKPRVLAISDQRACKSLFWAQTIPLRSRLRASLGARYDDPTDYDGAFTVSAGLEADVSDQSTWHMHVGTGRENPTPTDGDVLRGTRPLQATTLSAETGWMVRPDSASRWEVNAFWSRTEDARILYNDPPGAIGPTAYISKAEDLTTWGVELVYDREVSDHLRWFSNYTYLCEDVTNNNEPFMPGPLYPTIPEPPRHIAASGLRADLGATRVAFNVKYSGDYMGLNRLMRYAAPVDSFVTFDLKLTRTLGSGKASLFVDNLLDSDYETMPAFPRPGRNYLLSYSQSL